MDPISTLQLIYNVITGVHDAATLVEANKAACRSLAQRCSNLLPHLQILQERSNHDDSSLVGLLSQVLLLLHEIKEFMTKFQDRKYFLKAWKRNADAEAFNDFNSRLTQAIQDLHLGVTIDHATQKRDCLRDTQQDVEEMFELVQKMMLENSSLNDNVLNELRDARDEQLDKADHIAKRVEDAITQIAGVSAAASEKLQQLQNLERSVGAQNSSVMTFDRRQLAFQQDSHALLGKGQFGMVFRGLYQGMDVAVKVVQISGMNRRERDEMQREAQVHQILNGPRIIQLYGVEITDLQCLMVMEMAICTLHDWLYSEKIPLAKTMNVKLYILCDVAYGLEYLHSCNVIHRDMKPQNCLIAKDFSVKLSDFGLARIKTTDSMGTQANKGTPAYMAPEIVDDHPRYSRAVDVYAFGVMANEVMSGHPPFADKTTPLQIYHAVLDENARPVQFEVPPGDGIAAELRTLIDRTWHRDPDERPVMAALSMAVRRMAESVGTDPRNWMPNLPTSMNGQTVASPLSSMGSAATSKESTLNSTQLSIVIQRTIDEAWEKDNFDTLEHLDGFLKQATEIEQQLSQVCARYAEAKSNRDLQAVRKEKVAKEQMEAQLQELQNSFEQWPAGGESKDKQQTHISMTTTLDSSRSEAKETSTAASEQDDEKRVDDKRIAGALSVDSQREILMDLYHNTGGDRWKQKENWGSTEPLSQWFGVECDANGNVVKLNLENNQLTGTIPGTIGNLTNLQWLVLEDNQLTGTIPDTIGNLTNLQVLGLFSNQLTGTIPDTIGNLTNLQALGLHGNQLTGTIPGTIANLTSLRYLNLENNQLTGTIPGTIGNLTSLRELWLGSNKFTGTIPGTIGNLTNLQYLDLSHNQLTGTIPGTIGNLTSLKWLDLSTNQLTVTEPQLKAILPQCGMHYKCN